MVHRSCTAWLSHPTHILVVYPLGQQLCRRVCILAMFMVTPSPLQPQPAHTHPLMTPPPPPPQLWPHRALLSAVAPRCWRPTTVRTPGGCSRRPSVTPTPWCSWRMRSCTASPSLWTTRCGVGRGVWAEEGGCIWGAGRSGGAPHKGGEVRQLDTAHCMQVSPGAVERERLPLGLHLST